VSIAYSLARISWSVPMNMFSQSYDLVENSTLQKSNTVCSFDQVSSVLDASVRLYCLP